MTLKMKKETCKHKKDCLLNKMPYIASRPISKRSLLFNDEVTGWNAAIDACRLTSVVSEESIAEIINKEPLPQEGKKWEYSKKLAHAIAEYVNGGGK